jgi:hypothetical protein
MGWELEDVEKPFAAQLQALGWSYVEGSLDDPGATGRSSFAELIQEGVLRDQLRALNPGPRTFSASTRPLSPQDKALDDEALCQRSPKVQALVQARRTPRCAVASSSCP